MTLQDQVWGERREDYWNSVNNGEGNGDNNGPSGPGSGMQNGNLGAGNHGFGSIGNF